MIQYNGGTLRNPQLYGIHDADGVLLGGTTDISSGEGANSQVIFTADDAGTCYVAAGSHSNGAGTYTLSVEETM